MGSIYRLNKAGWITAFKPDAWRGTKPEFDLVNADTGEVEAPAGKKLSAVKARKLSEGGLQDILVPSPSLEGKFSAYDVVNDETGEIYAEAGDELTEELIAELRDAGIEELAILDVDGTARGPWLRNTLAADKNETRFEALSDIYRVMRPGEPPTQEAAETLFNQLFFDSERYDLSAVGRVKMNMGLDLDCPDD